MFFKCPAHNNKRGWERLVLSKAVQKLKQHTKTNLFIALVWWNDKSNTSNYFVKFIQESLWECDLMGLYFMNSFLSESKSQVWTPLLIS